MPVIQSSQNIGIIGAGSWGTAVAIHLARQGHQVRLCARDAEQADAMAQARENRRYLPGHHLPGAISLSSDWKNVCQQSQSVMLAVPSHAFVDVLRQLATIWQPHKSLAWLTKGLSSDADRPFLHHNVVHYLGDTTPMAMVSGPSFASEVASGMPTALLVTSEDVSLQKQWVSLFASDHMRMYTSEDWIGVQICAVMKNILAVAAGVVSGLGLGANAGSALITRGMAEVVRLTVALGGSEQTCLGLAGLGDIVLTCCNDLSRNHRLGLALGRGQGLQAATTSIGQAVESISNAQLLCRFAQQHDVKLPICEQVYGLLSGRITVHEAKEALLERPIGGANESSQ